MGAQNATLLNSPPPRFTLFPGCEFIRPKRKQIRTISDWVQDFMIYTAALSKRHPSATLELLAHQLTIIKASQQCDGLFWRAYDTLLHQRSSHREQNLVPLGHRPVHQGFFTGRAKQVTLCSVCDSTGHMAPDCPRRTCKWDFKLLTIQATPKRSVAGQCMRQVQHSGGVPVPGQVQVPPYLRGLQRQPPSQRLPPQGKPTKSEPSGGQDRKSVV